MLLRFMLSTRIAIYFDFLRARVIPFCFDRGSHSCFDRAEGPRLHIVTADGALWVAGTTHKGLGADHLSKTMQPAHDHLEFYRVGGAAADAEAPRLPTGAATVPLEAYFLPGHAIFGFQSKIVVLEY